MQKAIISGTTFPVLVMFVVVEMSNSNVRTLVSSSSARHDAITPHFIHLFSSCAVQLQRSNPPPPAAPASAAVYSLSMDVNDHDDKTGLAETASTTKLARSTGCRVFAISYSWQRWRLCTTLTVDLASDVEIACSVHRNLSVTIA